MDRARLEADLDAAAKDAKVNLPKAIKNAIFAALGERDPEAEICRDKDGEPEPDSELRDSETVVIRYSALRNARSSISRLTLTKHG